MTKELLGGFGGKRERCHAGVPVQRASGKAKLPYPIILLSGMLSASSATLISRDKSPARITRRMRNIIFFLLPRAKLLGVLKHFWIRIVIVFTTVFF